MSVSLPVPSLSVSFSLSLCVSLSLSLCLSLSRSSVLVLLAGIEIAVRVQGLVLQVQDVGLVPPFWNPGLRVRQNQTLFVSTPGAFLYSGAYPLQMHDLYATLRTSPTTRCGTQSKLGSHPKSFRQTLLRTIFSRNTQYQVVWQASFHHEYL